MRTAEEIEQLAKKEYNYLTEYEQMHNQEIVVIDAYIDGYTQCQEDIRELLLEIKNNWTGDKLIGGTYEKICNSLNKQD